jgi:hypothetical protein
VLVECDDTHKTTGKSDRVVFDVRVTNTGDTTREFYFEETRIGYHTPPGTDFDETKWQSWIDEDSATLEPGEVFSLLFTVDAQCGCQDGVSAIFQVTASLSTDQSVFGSVVLNATKGSDDVKDTANAFNLNVIMPPEDHGGLTTLDVSYQLNITGTWTSAERILLQVGSHPPGWTVTLGKDHLDVDDRSPETLELVSIHITIPKDVSPDFYPVTINARYQSDAAVFDSAELHLPVLADLEATGLTVTDGRPEVGTPSEVRATVVNLGIGTARDVRVLVRSEERVIHEETVETLGHMDERNISFFWTPAEGEGNLTMEVDPEGRIVEKDGGKNVLRVAVDVKGVDDPASGDDDGDSGGALTDIRLLMAMVMVLLVVVVMLVFMKGRESAPGGGQGHVPAKDDDKVEGGEAAGGGAMQGGPKERRRGAKGRKGKGGRGGTGRKRASGKSRARRR